VFFRSFRFVPIRRPKDPRWTTRFRVASCYSRRDEQTNGRRRVPMAVYRPIATTSRSNLLRINTAWDHILPLARFHLETLTSRRAMSRDVYVSVDRCLSVQPTNVRTNERGYDEIRWPSGRCLTKSHAWLSRQEVDTDELLCLAVEAHTAMEGASGHNDLSNTRRGGSTNQKTFPTPWRGADKSNTVLHAVVWANCVLLARPRHGVENSVWFVGSKPWRAGERLLIIGYLIITSRVAVGWVVMKPSICCWLLWLFMV